MGTFNYTITVADLNGGEPRETEAIVDTGAFFTTLPGRFLRDIGIVPTGRRQFLLADGRRVDLEIGNAEITIDGEDVITIVAFGEDNGPSLLGAYTLEGLALVVDPLNQRLVPNNMLTL